MRSRSFLFSDGVRYWVLRCCRFREQGGVYWELFVKAFPSQVISLRDR